MALTHLLSGIDLSFQQAAETSGGSGSYFSTLGTKNPRAGRGGRRVCVCREQQKNRASEGPTAPPPGCVTTGQSFSPSGPHSSSLK